MIAERLARLAVFLAFRTSAFSRIFSTAFRTPLPIMPGSYFTLEDKFKVVVQNLKIIRHVAGLAFGIVAILSLVCLVIWPDWAEQAFGSRISMAAFSMWTILMTAFVHPTIQRGLANGWRNFLESCDNLGGDNDFWW